MFSSGPFRTAAAAALAVTTMVAIPAQAQEGTGTGEVRRIDADRKKITIKHGPITELELPAITLVYLIDAALLAGLQPGDRVTFTARRENGQYVVIRISK